MLGLVWLWFYSSDCKRNGQKKSDILMWTSGWWLCALRLGRRGVKRGEIVQRSRFEAI